MFKKRREAVLETTEAYTRWLRAQRPPLEWFLVQTEPVQEQLALLGDEYVQDVATAVGLAVAHPEQADLGRDDFSPAADADRTRALAMSVAQAVLKGREPRESRSERTSAPEPMTMVGFQNRPSGLKSEPFTGPTTFFGRAPDEDAG